MTIEKQDIDYVKETVCSCFLDVTTTSSKLNTRSGSKKDFDEELELLYYMDILSTFNLPSGECYFNNQYASLVSTWDLGKIQNRALEIRAKLKRKTN